MLNGNLCDPLQVSAPTQFSMTGFGTQHPSLGLHHLQPSAQAPQNLSLQQAMSKPPLTYHRSAQQTAPDMTSLTQKAASSQVGVRSAGVRRGAFLLC